jgi:hypothetical protein
LPLRTSSKSASNVVGVAEMGEPSHGEILRAIGVLEGQLRQLLEVVADDGRERSSLGARVGQLEQRMAQVVIGAAALAVLSPLIWGEISAAMKARQPVMGPVPMEQRR